MDDPYADFQLTEEQVKQIKDKFRELDKHGGNRLNLYEIIEGVQSLGLVAEDPETMKTNAKKFFNDLDENGDGYIGYKEFEKYMKQIIAQLAFERKQLALAFEVFDKDKNGVLDRKELAKALKNYGNLTPEEEEEFFKLADENRDGKIQVEEFVNALSS